MFFKKRIESLENTIAEQENTIAELKKTIVELKRKFERKFERRFEKVEEKLNEMTITQSNQKNDEQITPAQILNEWLNGAKEG
jgi:uncharacterized coiled-coil protein SlyX